MLKKFIYIYCLKFNYFSENINILKILENVNANTKNIINNLLILNKDEKKNNILYENNSLLNLFYINIFELIVFLVCLLIFHNIKFILISVVIYVLLLNYNMFFFLGRYFIHMFTIITVFFILFFFGAENIALIGSLMVILRLFTIFLILSKLFSLLKENVY